MGLINNISYLNLIKKTKNIYHLHAGIKKEAVKTASGYLYQLFFILTLFRKNQSSVQKAHHR